MAAEDPESPWTAGLTSGAGLDELDRTGTIPPRALAFSEASEDGQPAPAEAAASTAAAAGSGGSGGAPSAEQQQQQQNQRAAAASTKGALPSGGLLSATARVSGDASGTGEGSSSSGEAEYPSEPLVAKIVCTSNQLEEEAFLPVRNIVTMFRIQVSIGDRTWDVMRRYSDFHELHQIVSKTATDPSTLPPLPPKLLLNDDASIAERYLELDAYLRALLASPTLSKHGRLLDFLGVEKHGVRYGVRRYEYDSAQSEGNRYIRDNDL